MLTTKRNFHYDTIIIGSGIVGLSVAASILERDPCHNILILERSFVPESASTRNAGFACVGSLTENLVDLEVLGEEGCINLIKMRYLGLLKLRERLGDENIGYKGQGGYEMIDEEGLKYLPEMDRMNKLLSPIFGGEPFELVNDKIEEFGFSKKHVKALIKHKYEGQIDSGKTIKALLQYVRERGAKILTCANVIEYKKLSPQSVCVAVENPTKDPETITFEANNLAICTNAYTKDLIKDFDMVPGRGQVLITKPIPGLKIKGIFFYDKGFYYFRDHEGRLLFGGGRNLDFQGERTFEKKTNDKIIDNLIRLLKEVILPGVDFEIDMKWAGIMSFGEKTRGPVITNLDENIFTAVRLSGMGMAISSFAGERIAEMILSRKKAETLWPRL